MVRNVKGVITVPGKVIIPPDVVETDDIEITYDGIIPALKEKMRDVMHLKDYVLTELGKLEVKDFENDEEHGIVAYTILWTEADGEILAQVELLDKDANGFSVEVLVTKFNERIFLPFQYPCVTHPVNL